MRNYASQCDMWYESTVLCVHFGLSLKLYIYNYIDTHWNATVRRMIPNTVLRLAITDFPASYIIPQ